MLVLKDNRSIVIPKWGCSLSYEVASIFDAIKLFIYAPPPSIKEEDNNNNNKYTNTNKMTKFGCI